MKTSVIRYRVADFLREHAPFDGISLEDLLTFSGGGRVQFHEDDILLFEKGQERGSAFWVVQQGRIEMMDESPQGQQLRDVLGPGDILGLRRDSADAVHQQTARTATEVILYAFDLSVFESLVGKYPEAARFLTAQLSADARYTKALQAPMTRERLLTEKEKTVWVNAADLPDAWLTRRLITCEPSLSMREIAKRLSRTHCQIAVVVAPDGYPLGLITNREIHKLVATGLSAAKVTAEDLMVPRFPTSLPGLRTADYLLEMLRGRGECLVITENGVPDAPLHGLISADDLAIGCGRNPILLLREILVAEDISELAYLRQQAEALLAESLVGPSLIEWLSQMLYELNAALIESVIRLTEAELARAGHSAPGLSHCWLLFGAAGRRELLLKDVPQVGLVYENPPKRQNTDVSQYFSLLAQKVSSNFEACGWRIEASRKNQESLPKSHSLSEWRTFFSERIQDPIGSQIGTAHDFFDLGFVAGEDALFQALQKGIGEELKGSEMFIPVLANDTLSHLPPLTIYQGAALDSDGGVNQTLDVEKTALTPITDAARTLAFSLGDVASANTLERLARLARAMPRYVSILNDAAEAWRIVCFHHTKAVLGTVLGKDSGGAVIYPTRLSKFDQRLLKASFDSTRRFVELVSTIHQINGTQ